MNQPGMVVGGQTGQGSTVSYIQPPTVIAAGYVPTKSCPLIGFGVVLFLLSGASLGLSAWIVKISDYEGFADVSLGCACIFMILSLFCMYGGNDVGNRQYCIIWAMVLGILGLVVATVAVSVNMVALARYLHDCVDCQSDDPEVVVENTFEHLLVDHNRCNDKCYMLVDQVAYGPVHVGLGVLALLEGLTALILSIAACCTACSCCCGYDSYHPHGGYVIQSPVGYSITTNPQVPYRPLDSNQAC